MSLITAFEVGKYSGAGPGYPTTLFCSLIPQIEQEFVRECLGTTTWNYLVSKLQAIPTGATEWQTCDIYQTGTLVIYFGCLYTSTANNNATVPGEDGADWEPFDKFTDEACNTLWVTYLRYLLAMKVYEPTITRATWRTNAGGAVINAADNSGMRAANKAELSTIRGDIKRDIERVTTNMIEWFRINTDNGIPTPYICAAGNCQTKGANNRRWGFHKENTRFNLIQ
jgi:hypothetical protein